MNSLDFHYLIVSNQAFDEESLQNTFTFFGALGIRKFIFTVPFDLANRSVGILLDKMQRLRIRLHKCCPRGCSFELFPYVDVAEDTVFHADLSRCLIKSSPYIFFRISAFYHPSNTDSALNHLCFQRKYRPIFTSFEDAIRTGSSEHIDRLTGSRLLCFSMDLNFMTEIESKNQMLQWIRQGTFLLPSISHDLSNYTGILNRFQLFKEDIGASNYTKFFRSVHTLGHRLFF